jgi:hypothetical protein
MDEHHGDGVAPLQFAQEGKQRRDVATDILIDAMQAHERIKDEKARFQPGYGLKKNPVGPPRYARDTNRRPSNSVIGNPRQHIPFRAQAHEAAGQYLLLAPGL